MDVLLPGTGWGVDRGYQWNLHHNAFNANGDITDSLVHASGSFMANTSWVAAAFQIGLFGAPYKDVMRQWKQRAGAFVFTLKPAITGQVLGTLQSPEIVYPIVDTTGYLEPKTMSDMLTAVTQVAEVYKSIGAFAAFPNPNTPLKVLKQQLSLFVTTSGALHPQGTCRAGTSQSNSVVDTNLMSWDVQNLMCCDASVIPNALSSNPNATIMAIASRASDFINHQILGATSAPTAPQELEKIQAAAAATGGAQ
jgi:choline dehydrogenase-like flavoprotein